MHKHFLLLITILITFSPYVGMGQNKRVDIADIKKEFIRINLEKSYQLKKLSNEQISNEVTDGGSELIGYYQNGSLRKIVITMGLSYGLLKFEFYYRNETLIFVYEQTDSFVFDQKKQEFRYDKTERSFEGRYYFKNEKLLDYTTTGHNRFENDRIDPEKTLLTESKKYKNLFARKN